MPVPAFLAFERGNRVFENVAAAEPYDDFSITGGQVPERLSGMRVSASYFDVFGVKPLLGRTFLPGEDQAGGDGVVVFSYGIWQQRFSGDPHIIGKTVMLDGRKYSVIGVMGAGFRLTMYRTQVWKPLVLQPDDLAPHTSHSYRVFARLKSGTRLEQARAETSALALRVEQAAPKTEQGRTSDVLTLQEFGIREEGIREGLVLLMTAVALVLLIGCGNLANLLMARGSSRQQDIAIRVAFGAGRRRIIRQLLVECLLISVLGSCGGLLLAYWSLDLLRGALHFNADISAMAADVALDHRVLAFTVLVSMATALIFGLAPAIRISASDPQNTLRQGGRGGDLRRGWGRNLLVASEIALAVFLVSGAALVIKATADEISGDYGYDPNRVLIADLALTSPRYQDPLRRAAFARNVLDKLRGLPRVEAAAATCCLPLPYSTGTSTFEIRGEPALPVADRSRARYFAVTPDYFKALGVALLQGRAFRESDTSHAPDVAIVNRAFAKRFFAHREAIGSYVSVDISDKPTAPV